MGLVGKKPHKKPQGFLIGIRVCTVCPRSLDPICKATYDLKWIEISCTDSIIHQETRNFMLMAYMKELFRI